MATATVTPSFACLGTVSRPPERTAARSQTLSTPVTLRTKSEEVKAALNLQPNSFVGFWGYRQFQVAGQLEPAGGAAPQITRREYLRLLSAEHFQADSSDTGIYVRLFR